MRMSSSESPLTLLFQRGEQGLSPFEKGGGRRILKLIAHCFNVQQRLMRLLYSVDQWREAFNLLHGYQR
jgi:hypothetical protein